MLTAFLRFFTNLQPYRLVQEKEYMSKILIVDDSEVLRYKLKKDLIEADYEVIEASDGLVGLEILEENPDTHLIIADVFMPNLDGLGMCEEISKNSNLNHIPIILLSSHTDAAMRSRGKEFGVKAWIIKPYLSKALVVVVEKVIIR